MQKGCLSLEQQHFLTRFHILEINKVSALKFREHGLQVIDLYMSLQSLISKRKDDGIHWTPEANSRLFQTTPRLLSDYSKTTPRLLPDFSQTTPRGLPDYSQISPRALRDYSQTQSMFPQGENGSRRHQRTRSRSPSQSKIRRRSRSRSRGSVTRSGLKEEIPDQVKKQDSQREEEI